MAKYPAEPGQQSMWDTEHQEQILKEPAHNPQPASAAEPLTRYPTQVHIKDSLHQMQHLPQAAQFFT